MRSFFILLFVLFASTLLRGQNINELIAQLNQTKEDEIKIQISKKIALAYQKQKGYGKAIEYYQRALDLEKANKKPLHQQGETQKDIAFCYLMMQDYTKAKENYKKVLEIEKADSNKVEISETLEALAAICTENQEYKEAISYYQELLEYYKDNLSALANTYNNIGYSYKKLGDTKKALENFNQSIKINQKIANQNKGNTSIRAVALMNIGSTYINEDDFKGAKKYYEDALIIRRSQNNKVEEAKLYNFLAINEFLTNRNENALDYVDKAIAIAERELGGVDKLKAQEVLIASYQIKANIYQQQQDLKEYQKNYQKYLDLQKLYQEEDIRQRQEMIEKQLELEKKESEIKTNIAQEEKREMELLQAKLEKEKAKKEAELRESEIRRLKADKELQAQKLRNAAIEKQRAEQQLEILRQKAEAERKEQQIAALEKDKEIERQKREVERKEEERKREILEKEKQLADLKAKEEEKKNFYTLIGLAVVGTFLIFVGYLLILNRQKNKKLAAQNATIEEQNKELQVQAEELQQQQEEIMAQRDAIAQQNQILAEQNEKIEKSINAAKTIQTAILPHTEKLQKIFKDFFILFMPRDVVSGDFYWIEQLDENKIVVAVVDCTGHGVPGAFMSLIGNRLLEKIVILNGIHKPSEILENLHQEVRNLLRQQETGNRDGMDVALCVLEKMPDSKTKVSFAGAKRPLYYTENEHTQIFTLKGSRKSIGGDQNENIKFETNTFILPPNSCIYLSSDGITDQNDVERVKLGESKLKYTLSNVAALPMQEQYKAIKNLLENQLKGTLQRDDILLIGIRL